MKKIFVFLLISQLIYTGCIPDSDDHLLPLPYDKDYREYDFFTPVKNQGDLGSCWAFACNGLAEYYLKMNLSITVDLSEQHLVNCAGFGPEDGMKYLRDNGVTIEDSLIYTEQIQGCNTNVKSLYKIDDYVLINVQNLSFHERIDKLKRNLINEGPFVTHLDLYDDLGSYESGIYEYDGTSPSGGGHIVVIVGYYDDESVKNGGYWICRNSWGEEWGEEGYFRIPYDEVNIAMYYAYQIKGVSKIETITKLPVSGYHCRWSNDGKKIAYVKRNNSGIKLFVYNLVTKEETTVVDDMDGDMHLSWLDDGNTIVFDAYDSNNQLDLWKVDIESGDVEFMVDNALVPDVHPTLDKMVCSKNERLVLYNKSGTLISYIGNVNGGLAAISPDGTKVAYVTGPSENEDIWIVNIDGTNAQQITSHEGRDYWPRWSPDGNKIAFESERSGNSDIWIYDLVKEEFNQLTNDTDRDGMGDWSPGGKSILYISQKGGVWGTYIINNI